MSSTPERNLGGWDAPAPADAPPHAPKTRDPEPHDHQPGLGELVAELSRDLSTLMRQEVELAKAEATASARRAGRGAGLLTGAGIAAHLVLVFLSVAGWWSLGYLLGRGWSALIVAAVWAVVAVILGMRGRRQLRGVRGMPETVGSVKKMPEVVKGHEEKKP